MQAIDALLLHDRQSKRYVGALPGSGVYVVVTPPKRYNFTMADIAMKRLTPVGLPILKYRKANTYRNSLAF